MNQYVCAFRGRRDSYQVPLALAEAGMLDHLITDAYSGRVLRALSRLAPRSLRSKLEFRHMIGIPESDVKSLWTVTVYEHLRHRLGCSPESTYLQLDKRYSAAAAKRAHTSNSSLLLYSSYAWEAFSQHYAHSPHKVLFQYHPHPDFEREILDADRAQFADEIDFKVKGRAEIAKHSVSPGERDAWRHADRVICASNFTKRSLIAAGAAPHKCVVIPYGVDFEAEPKGSTASEETFRVLFVGSGVHRKGLHHLLIAWRSARLPNGSTLTLVCRNIDEHLKDIAQNTPGVELLPGVSAEDLSQKYKCSHLFAMPSLVEGFGQVYLESLIQGCPVLGTENTCLPDLGIESDGIFLCPPGDIDALIDQLERLSTHLPGNDSIRQSSYRNALRWSWARFRKELIATLKE